MEKSSKIRELILLKYISIASTRSGTSEQVSTPFCRQHVISLSVCERKDEADLAALSKV